ncbi:MAG: hypothetical protein EPO16_09925, partial [Dehalococcoidia bacterium]
LATDPVEDSSPGTQPAVAEAYAATAPAVPAAPVAAPVAWMAPPALSASTPAPASAPAYSSTVAVAVTSTTTTAAGEVRSAASLYAEARQKGYEGDPCGDCGQLMLVRNGTCLKCMNCGATSGCS